MMFMNPNQSVDFVCIIACELHRYRWESIAHDWVNMLSALMSGGGKYDWKIFMIILLFMVCRMPVVVRLYHIIIIIIHMKICLHPSEMCHIKFPVNQFASFIFGLDVMSKVLFGKRVKLTVNDRKNICLYFLHIVYKFIQIETNIQFFSQ